MPFLMPTLDNADLLFALVITPNFYLHPAAGAAPPVAVYNLSDIN